MAEIPKPDFSQLAKNAGVPLDKSQWKAVLKQEADKQGSIIANDSKYSPFWRLMEALVITPTLWIIQTLLIGYVLPNMFVATATGQWLNLWAWQFDLTRKPASKTKGKVLFHRVAERGPMIIIPAGTWVQTEIINNTVYRVKVLADTPLLENETVVAVDVQAENAGDAYNLGGGYYRYLSKPITGVHNVGNTDDWIVEAGANEETDDDLRLRIRNQFTSVAKWHIDAAYRAILTKRAGINDDNVYFLHDAPRGAGTANAYILLDTGEPSSQMLLDLNTCVMTEGKHGHGDDMAVMAMPNQSVDVTCRLFFKRELIEEKRQQLAQQVELLIQSAFRENTDFSVTKTAPNTRFSFSRLAQEIHDKFDGIDSLEFENRDIITEMWVPRINTLKVVPDEAA
ncbi:baseplate J/gp47 family protein [Photobacterium angustum]|uniref:Baseplate protein J-like barrel domain-containing protein n=1 Tax=Photobacterium angustum TaxID=661 RepID=A0A855SE98_PHOAN|nr:baseplate J/gp47 family protein [Photobacterium angustum]KJG42579.1 phage protein [Photobacterium angustum]KJG49879.1 phage protein [Photobacterium angustum]KJG54029.1 phage protein [Photobacterium angustum]PSX08581.1 hypothetical protein C0W41_05685 [Photobacterium angustum]PSX13923.1 hypothetical protein C0W55_12990 [Photobacterium angustum]